MGRYAIELGVPQLDGLPFDDWPVPCLVTLESGRDGPHAMVIAAVHGNEICGVHALAAFFEAGIRPARGRITLAVGNVAAYRRFEPTDPVASRYLDEDFNRVWRPALLDGRRSSCELERAQCWPHSTRSAVCGLAGSAKAPWSRRRVPSACPPSATMWAG